MTDQTAQHPAAPETDVSAIETLAVRLYLADRRNGGAPDSWSMLADNRRAPYRRMAYAAQDHARERLRVVEGEREFWRSERWAAQEVVRAATARAESAEAVIAKVERVVSDAEERDRQSLSRTFNGGTFGAYIPAAALRALLPGDGR